MQSKCLLVLYSPLVLLLFLPSPLPFSPHLPLSCVCLCVVMSVCIWAGVFLYVHACVCVLLECWPTRKEGERLPRHQSAGSWQGEEGLKVQWDDNRPRWTPGLYEKAVMWRKQHTHSHSLLNTFSSLCSYVPNTHIHTNPLKGLQSLSLVVMHVSVVLCFSQPPCTSPLHPNLISDQHTHRCLGLCPWTCVSSPVLWRALRPSTTSSLRCRRVSGGHVGVLGQELHGSTTSCLKIPTKKNYIQKTMRDYQVWTLAVSLSNIKKSEQQTGMKCSRGEKLAPTVVNTRSHQTGPGTAGGGWLLRRMKGVVSAHTNSDSYTSSPQ